MNKTLYKDLMNYATEGGTVELADDLKWWCENVLKNLSIDKRLVLDYGSTRSYTRCDLTEFEHILDYLKSEARPKRIKKMSFQHAYNNSQKWLRRLNKKGNKLIDVQDKDYKVKLKLKDGFQFVELLTKNAYQREGNLMGHCLGGYEVKEGRHVYSLRDSHNKPHCTIETFDDEDGRVNQIKGKGNGHIHPKYIDHVLKFLKYLGLSIRDSEMQNLGYVQYSDEALKLIKKHGLPNCYKFITFQGKEYVTKVGE